MGEIKFIRALVFISIFAIAITAYAIGFANDNHAVVNLDQDGELASISTQAQNNSNNFYLDTNTSSNSFFNSQLVGDDVISKTGGEFKIGLRPLLSTPGTILSSAKKNIFGDNAAFAAILSLFSSFLVFLGVRYIVKTWKGGNPD